MINKKILTNKTRNTFIISLSIFIAFVIAGFIMLKYDVQGEKNLPFELTKINIISSAKEETLKDENDNWIMKILQNNDIYFYIDKNENNKKKNVIDKIVFDNFRITSEDDEGKINVYRPTDDEIITYKYTDEYKADEIIYKGSQVTSTKFMEINNQGGMVEFSVANIELGNYPIEQEQTLSADGSLLKLINKTYDDVKFTIIFDMYIVVENENTYMTTITFDLPGGDITKEGVVTIEDTELEDIVFKRIFDKRIENAK